MYFIRAEIDPNADRSELLEVTDAVIEQAESFFENADVADKLNLAVERGVMEFSDGSEIPFTNYKALVSAAFTDGPGDRWFVTQDGGFLNVSGMLAMLREAVDDARAGSESSAD